MRNNGLESIRPGGVVAIEVGFQQLRHSIAQRALHVGSPASSAVAELTVVVLENDLAGADPRAAGHNRPMLPGR